MNGKTYVVAGSGHEVERSVYMGKTARLTLEVPIQISESFKESGFKDELNKLGIKVINESYWRICLVYLVYLVPLLITYIIPLSLILGTISLIYWIIG